MKRSNDIWILISLFVLLLTGSYLVTSPDPRVESKAPTSYNADPAGTKAFYALLGRFGYSTDRLRKPYTEIPENAKMLVVVAPGKRVVSGSTSIGRDISSEERSALYEWVKGGGSVIFAADELRGVPWRFKENGPIGKGYVYVFDSISVINNKGMRRPENAVRLANAVSERVLKGELILFDEYHHGLSEHRSLMESISRQVKAAILVVLTAALALCYSRGRRFGAVRSLPASEYQRPGFEFVESVGRLYRRARAADLAADILCDSFKRGLCAKLGLDGGSTREAVLRKMQEQYTAEICRRVDELLVKCERSKAGEKKSESELVDTAVEIRNLEKELGIGAVDG